MLTESGDRSHVVCLMLFTVLVFVGLQLPWQFDTSLDSSYLFSDDGWFCRDMLAEGLNRFLCQRLCYEATVWQHLINIVIDMWLL